MRDAQVREHFNIHEATPYLSQVQYNECIGKSRPCMHDIRSKVEPPHSLVVTAELSE